jgi:hypothetical protein
MREGKRTPGALTQPFRLSNRVRVVCLLGFSVLLQRTPQTEPSERSVIYYLNNALGWALVGL